MKNLNLFKILKSNKGFTLVEILLYIGIFSILIVVLFQLLSSIFDVQLESQSTSSVVRDGRFILNRFSYDIGQAKTIISPISLGSQSASLQFSIGSTTYTYLLVNENLTLANSSLGTTDELNSINTAVSNLNFLRLSDTNGDNDTVTISFILTSKIIKRGEASLQSFTTTMGTR